MLANPLALLDRSVLSAVQAEVEARFGWLIAMTRACEPADRPFQVAVPRTANEKMVWRKIFDHDPRFVTISDKLAVKRWAKAFGAESAPVLWVGQDATDIPPGLLSRRIAIKANHGCGTNLFVADGSPPRDEVIAKANAFLQRDHGRKWHEWGYFGVKRTLFAEEFLGEGEGFPTELKVYTFGPAITRVVMIAERFGGMAASRWEPDSEGRLVRSEQRTAISKRVLDRPLPPTVPQAMALSRAIGSQFDQMRIDFLTDGERLWLGELTVYNLGGYFPDNGHDPKSPYARLWDLRRTWFLRAWHANPRLWRYAGALRRELARRSAEVSAQLDLPEMTGGAAAQPASR